MSSCVTMQKERPRAARKPWCVINGQVTLIYALVTLLSFIVTTLRTEGAEVNCSDDFTHPTLSNGNTISLPIGFLTQSLTDKESRQAISAVQLALEEIKSTQAQPSESKTSWEMTVNTMSTDWQRIRALEASLSLIHDNHSIALLGMAASSTVSVVGPVVGSVGVPAIATAVTNRDTREGTYYPTFMRACPSDSNVAESMKDIILDFVWDDVAVISSVAFSGYHAVSDLVGKLLLYGIDITQDVSVEFDGDGFDRESGQRTNLSEETKAGLSAIATSGLKIIVLNVHSSEMLALLRYAKTIGLLDRGYAWIVAQFFAAPELLPAELLNLLDGSIVFRPTIDAARASSFAKSLNQRSPSVCPSTEQSALSLEAVYAYDATHALGNAIQKWVSQTGIPTLESCNQSTEVLSPTFKLRRWQNAPLLVDILRNSAPMPGVGGQLSLSSNSAGSNYDIFNLVRGKLVKLGQWTKENNLELDAVDDFTVRVQWTGDTYEIPSTHSFVKQHLNIVVPISFPFTSVLHDPPRGNNDFSGIAIDMIEMIANITGFNYTLHHWTGLWTEMVRTVGNSTSLYDMAAGSITVNAERSALCTFTNAVYLAGLRILVRRPKAVQQGGYWSFFLPFHWSVWCVLVLMLILSGIVLASLDPDGVTTLRQRSKFVDGLFFSFTSFFFVHEADGITAVFGRVYLIILQFSMLVLVTAYTANMATFLSAQSQAEVTEFNDLYQKPVAVRNGTSNWAYVTEQLGLRNVVPVRDGDEAVSVLREESVEAYIADSPHIINFAASACDLIVLGPQVETQQYAFALKKNSPWRPEIDRALGILINKGVVSKLFEKYVPSQCPPYSQSEAVKSLTLDNLGGLFILAVAATVLPGLVKLYYIATRKKKVVKWETYRRESLRLDAQDFAGLKGNSPSDSQGSSPARQVSECCCQCHCQGIELTDYTRAKAQYSFPSSWNNEAAPEAAV